MLPPHDAILAGAGHGGLATAAYQARAGRRVPVLERREPVDGICVTGQLWPGFRVSPGGNIFHGEMSLDRMLAMRPLAGWARCRTPVRSLFLCGSGAHPAGGVTGAPGCNAAREILSS